MPRNRWAPLARECKPRSVLHRRPIGLFAAATVFNLLVGLVLAFFLFRTFAF